MAPGAAVTVKTPAQFTVPKTKDEALKAFAKAFNNTAGQKNFMLFESRTVSDRRVVPDEEKFSNLLSAVDMSGKTDYNFVSGTETSKKLPLEKLTFPSERTAAAMLLSFPPQKSKRAVPCPVRSRLFPIGKPLKKRRVSRLKALNTKTSLFLQRSTREGSTPFPPRLLSPQREQRSTALLKSAKKSTANTFFFGTDCRRRFRAAAY